MFHYEEPRYRPSNDSDYYPDHSSTESDCLKFNRHKQSRESYLKAFKKDYVEKLLQSDLFKDREERLKKKSNKQNVNEFQPPRKNSKREPCKQIDQNMKNRNPAKNEEMNINKLRIANIVKPSDHQIQEMLYSSISQWEKEINLTCGEANMLVKQNKQLKCSIEKLKNILREKLEVALRKNKEEITSVLEQYVTMIKKLLGDKQALSQRVAECQEALSREREKAIEMQLGFEKKLENLSDTNEEQIATAKQQIEEFLEIIVEYEEQANIQRKQMEKMQEKIFQLQLEKADMKKTTKNVPQILVPFSSEEGFEKQKYLARIHSLAGMLEKVRQQNQQLVLFLQTCKCSRIQSRGNLASKSQSSINNSFGIGKDERGEENFKKIMIIDEKPSIPDNRNDSLQKQKKRKSFFDKQILRQYKGESESQSFVS